MARLEEHASLAHDPAAAHIVRGLPALIDFRESPISWFLCVFVRESCHTAEFTTGLRGQRSPAALLEDYKWTRKEYWSEEET